MGKEICGEFCKRLNLEAACFIPFLLRFWLLFFINVQSFGEEIKDISFCYDGSKEGYRLNSEVIKNIQAKSGLECIYFCMIKDESCRSINFRKSPISDENCELLKTVDYEEPAQSLKKDGNYDYYILLQPKRKTPDPIPSNAPAVITQQLPTTNQELSSSCYEILKRNRMSTRSPINSGVKWRTCPNTSICRRSLTNGVYELQNKDSLQQFQVYCHMSEIPGCGSGGWTLVMKVDGNQIDFNYSSPYWTNKIPYAVEDGLTGLTEKQTKLPSYWNTPFSTICLGMKVKNVTKWISFDHQGSSLFNEIEDGTFKKITAGREKWKSLSDGSLLQQHCNKEGFNYHKEVNSQKFGHMYMKMRIGMAANNENDCKTPDTCIGFGTSVRGCYGNAISATCGSMAICLYSSNIAAFGFIFVQ